MNYTRTEKFFEKLPVIKKPVVDYWSDVDRHESRKWKRVKVEGDLVKENAPQSPTFFSHFTCLFFPLHLVSALKRQVPDNWKDKHTSTAFQKKACYKEGLTKLRWRGWYKWVKILSDKHLFCNQYLHCMFALEVCQ